MKTTSHIVIGNVPLKTETVGGPELHVVGSNEASPKRKRFTDIDELVRREEATPDGLPAMRAARAELGALLEAGGDGTTIRKRRLAKGMSQATLAALVGSKQGHIARIESGRVDVQVGTLVRIARALDIPPMEAVGAFLNQFLQAADEG